MQAVKGGKTQEAEALPSDDDEWVTAGVREEVFTFIHIFEQ